MNFRFFSSSVDQQVVQVQEFWFWLLCSVLVWRSAREDRIQMSEFPKIKPPITRMHIQLTTKMKNTLLQIRGLSCLCIVICLAVAQQVAAASQSDGEQQEVDINSERLNPNYWFKYSDRPIVIADANEGNAHNRFKRNTPNNHSNRPNSMEQTTVDACPSKMEVITPYYATNAKGKLRTIVNSELMQQAIQVETCARLSSATTRPKCNSEPDCSCEQKYKWHRLLVLDPKDPNASRGLFMDWFLFPSACQCRCKPSGGTVNRLFLHHVTSTSSPLSLSKRRTDGR